MKTNLLVRVLAQKQNGAFFKMSWKKDLPLTAEARRSGVTAQKISEGNFRKGISYANQKAVQEKVAAGKVLTHELPWGQWKTGYEGLLIEHKGNDYLRAYIGGKPKAKYYLNGREVTYQELKDSGKVQASFFKPLDEKPDALTIKTDNILYVMNKKKK